MIPSPDHIPVLLPEVLHALAITPGELHVDGTFGAGGYTRAMANAGAKVHAFDQDPDAIAAGQSLVTESGGQITLHHARFGDMAQVLAAANIDAVDGVTLDIGVSSMHLDQAQRGFSFQSDGPADMRMAQDGPTAADFLNEADEAVIADVLYQYGEERQSRRIARAIVAARPITTTTQIAAIVRKAIGKKPGDKKDPATRTFQAIRIHINDELGELERGLEAAERLLRPGGKIAVVTFHSLEDRIVKNFLRERSGSDAAPSRHLPQNTRTRSAPTFLKPAKAVRPTQAEQALNPRARSATLRSAERTSAAPRSASAASNAKSDTVMP